MSTLVDAYWVFITDSFQEPLNYAINTLLLEYYLLKNNIKHLSVQHGNNVLLACCLYAKANDHKKPSNDVQQHKNNGELQFWGKTKQLAVLDLPSC